MNQIMLFMIDAKKSNSITSTIIKCYIYSVIFRKFNNLIKRKESLNYNFVSTLHARIKIFETLLLLFLLIICLTIYRLKN